MPKSKFSPAEKIEVVNAYLSGDGSYAWLAQKYGVCHRTIQDWVKKYLEHGETCFAPRIGYKTYSSEFKKQCVDAVLRGVGTVDDIVVKYNLSNRSLLIKWIMRYNANQELKDYDPKREVYMANARRKTTLAERREITEYCIAHDKNYKETAALYDVSYSQVYYWVKKYLSGGIDSLVDKRGQHKSDDEVDELEKLRRENVRLKRMLEERDMTVKLLKKVKEFERM